MVREEVRIIGITPFKEAGVEGGEDVT